MRLVLWGEDGLKSNVFTKDKTLILKGIAIILLLFHHVFYSTYTLRVQSPQLFIFSNLTGFLCKNGAISIFIFAILSGYGLAASSETDKLNSSKIIIHRERKLLSIYIPIYLIGLIGLLVDSGVTIRTLQAVYGENIQQCLLSILLDMLGVADLFGLQILNPTMWYMSAAHIIIVGGTVYDYFDKKTRMGTEILALLIMYGATHQGEVLFDCLLAGCIGVWLYSHRILQKISLFFSGKCKRIIELLVLLLLFWVYIFIDRSELIDFYYLAALFMCLTLIITNDYLAYIPVLNKIMYFLGERSSVIFMIHTYYIVVWKRFSCFVYSFQYAWQTFAIVLIMCLVVSFIGKASKKMLQKVNIKG